MATVVLVNTAPYGTEGPYNALRLAQALALQGEEVDLFFMGDGVHTGRAGQEPLTAHASLEGMLREVLERAVPVTLCGTCCKARGVAENELVKGVRVGTIKELADLVRRADRVVSF
jgi:sulfur relay (sulfurtransferase) complex TusBCD TusD component (DsrE family)